MFTSQNKKVKYANQFIWFEKWVIGRRTIHQLSQESKCSIRSLKRLLKIYLNTNPKLTIRPSQKTNLLIDGTYFSNGICLIVYRDAKVKYTQFYRITNGEHFTEIREDLGNLIKLGLQIESVTCDGHKAMLKAIRYALPNTLIQRCIVHIQRDCRIWLTQNPKSEAGVELKRIVSKLHLIKTQNDKVFWLNAFDYWYEKYSEYINEKSFNPETERYWYKHKMVRRSYSTIKRALPNMFYYLENKEIPKSTNSIESFFGHLKNNLNIHRGLSYENRKQFLKWYLYFKNS